MCLLECKPTGTHTHKALQLTAGVFLGIKVLHSAFHIWVKGKPHDKHWTTLQY